MSDNLYQLLEQKYLLYNNAAFIETDPISIPHLFTIKEDIEIAGFLTATISWGQRKAIIRQAKKMITALDNAPYQFVTGASEKELHVASRNFLYRTFNPDDGLAFLNSLRNIYLNRGGLENVFCEGYRKNNSVQEAIHHLRAVFLSTPHLSRTEKHIANVYKSSSGKRLNMYLRWMVRNDSKGVDFGLWKTVSTRDLMLPLDVHTGNISRKLGLLSRKQNDWKAVAEVTDALKKIDPEDPVKYDFALFGMGVFENNRKKIE